MCRTAYERKRFPKYSLTPWASLVALTVRNKIENIFDVASAVRQWSFQQIGITFSVIMNSMRINSCTMCDAVKGFVCDCRRTFASRLRLHHSTTFIMQDTWMNSSKALLNRDYFDNRHSNVVWSPTCLPLFLHVIIIQCHVINFH